MSSLEEAMELESNLLPEVAPLKPKPVPLPPRVRIMLEEDENIPPGGLYLGLNGVGYILRAGMEADVPAGIVDILDHAITTVPVLDPVTKQTMGYRNKRRYSYRVIST
jgi:hypothetical protein